MEKYGVDEVSSQTKKTKTAQKTDELKCPTCGKKLKNLNKTGGVLICPQCGSQPFES